MRQRLLLETGHWGTRELTGFLRARKTAVRSLVASAQSMLDGRPVFPVNSGRGALAMALSMLAAKHPERKRVIIPEYICPAVPQTLRYLGLDIAVAPVGNDLNVDAHAMIDMLDSSVLAVIPVHMYGHIAETSIIAKAAREVDAGLIDDAAQVFGVVGSSGYIPGTAGEFGLISFGQSKTIVCGYPGAGGLLIVNDADYVTAATAAFDALPSARKTQLFAYTLVGRHLRPHPDPLWRVMDVLKQLDSIRTDELGINITKISTGHAAIGAAQIESLPERIADKRRVAKIYDEELRAVDGISFPQYEAGRYLTRIMLDAGSLRRRNLARNALAASGIATRSGYPALDADIAPPHHRVERPLFELPSNFGLTETAIRDVARAVSRIF